MVSLLPTKTLTIDGDTRLGQFGIPALLWLPVVQGLLPFNFILQSVRVNGRRLSPEPARRFVFHFFSALLSQSANFSKGEGSASNSLFFALAMAMATFTVFQVLSVTYSGQVKGIVVARKDAFHNKIRNDSSEQVCDSCWIRQGGMNPSGNTFLGRKLDPPTWSLNLQLST